jgi:hypothetical protein
MGKPVNSIQDKMKGRIPSNRSWGNLLITMITLSSIVWRLASTIPASAEIIQPSRMVNWSIVGYPGTIPDVPVVLNVKDFGAKGDGVTDDYAAITATINAAPNPGAVFLPEGTYRFNDTLRLREGIVLRGAGSDKTFLECNLGGAAKSCVEILTYQRGNFVVVQSGLEKGSTTLLVTDTSQFQIGEPAEIQQENDPEIMYTRLEWDESWAANAVGQFARISSIEGNRLILDRPLNMDFNPSLNPVIRPNGLISNVGFEDFHIQRLDAGDGYTFHFKNASDSWIRRVESEYTYRAHVNLTTSLNIEIRESYFHHSHDYGGGGHGYGVEISTHSTNCLVENNVFEHLRHSMMVHLGGNGNVFGYNYSFDPFQNDGGWTPTDISVHGHYPFMNLFEGNIVQEAGSADWWGPAGPGMTFFRNRIESENLDIMDHSHNQNIIGNEFTGETNNISIEPEIMGILVHGNNVRGQVTWDPSISDHDLPDSYYLTTKPAFYSSMQWPSIGGDQPIGEGTIPAKARYDAGEPIPSEEPISSFSDVPTDHWAFDYIEALYQNGYVAGCSEDPLMYCPDEPMTRAESAVFVERGIWGADYTPPSPTEVIFDDVPLSEWFAKWASALWNDGYTAGCNSDPLQYCPLQEHTMAEGAVFYLRMLNGSDYEPPDPTGIFQDAPLDEWYTKWVEAAYNAGIYPSCQTSPQLLACPEDPLTRAMGAYMMVMAKGIPLE